MAESVGRRASGMSTVLGDCRMDGMLLRIRALGIDGQRKAEAFADGEE